MAFRSLKRTLRLIQPGDREALPVSSGTAVFYGKSSSGQKLPGLLDVACDL